MLKRRFWAPAQKTKKFLCETNVLFGLYLSKRRVWTLTASELICADNASSILSLFFDACHNNRFIEKTSMDRGGEQFFKTRSSLSSLDAFSAMDNQKTPFDGAFPSMTSTNPKMSRRAHQPWERQPPGKGLQYAFLHHNNYDSYKFFPRWLHYSRYLRLQISLFQLFRDKCLEGEVLKH